MDTGDLREQALAKDRERRAHPGERTGFIEVAEGALAGFEHDFCRMAVNVG